MELAAGQLNGSQVGYTYAYNDLDDYRKPTTGTTFAFSQQFSGFGGNLKFLKTFATAATYTPMFDGALIGMLSGRADYITGYGGSSCRSRNACSTAATLSAALRWPASARATSWRPAIPARSAARSTPSAPCRYASPAGAGKLWPQFGPVQRFRYLGPSGQSPATRVCTGAQYSGTGTCVRDNLAFRASAGISVQWKSPFGPVQIDLGLPYIKTSYDRPQIIHFSTATGY